MVGLKAHLEYVVTCCGKVYRLFADDKVDYPFHVGGYVNTTTGNCVAMKHGHCLECREKRPKTDLQIRIQ